MGLNINQIKAILWKNFLIGVRTKEFFREIISVLILSVMLVVLEHNQSNNILSPFYMSMAIIGYSRSVGFNWVLEKETFQKEMQNIMGISYLTYYVSWLIYFLLNALYVCLVMLLILWLAVIVPSNSIVFQNGYGFSSIVLLYFIYAISIIGFILFFSVFFKKAKIAAMAMIFTQLLLNFLFFLRFSEEYRTNKGLLWLSAISPQVTFNLGISRIAFINQSLPVADFSYQDSIVALIVTGLVYFLLSLYLQQVLPNSQGTRKHPLFFLNIFRKQRQNYVNQQIPLLQQNEEHSANYYEVRHGNINPIIKLQSLSKIFGATAAVDNVTMNFYANQIFCLLGHNGAGKSTTINLLTGLLQPTSGNIELLGLNYWNNKDQIRRNIGLCLQFNVLYEDLTVEEHLKFYALLKGLNPESIDANVQQIINQCSLASQKGKFVKNLSGGNKRKVSLANALMGRSKIVFLDEPSSGLDPSSRQGIWSIIKSVRTPERCLILTTHHLEEAEELSQAIGIMALGKMVIIGSSEFIKEKFNVGFHLLLNFSEDKKQNVEQCRKLILQTIPTAKQDQQTAIGTSKFMLNTTETKNFSSLFAKLEPLCHLSLKASSLEDAFIKLGEESAGEDSNPINDSELQLPSFECSYSFTQQFRAVFFRKVTSTLRSLSTLVSIILPTIFILMGVVLSSLVIDGDNDDPVILWFKRFMLAYFMVWAFVFNTSSYCGDLVLEREKRFKYLSHVLGLRKLPYWLANYAFNVIIFVIPLIFFFIAVYMTGKQGKFITDVVGYIILTLIFFCFSFIGYSFLFSFMFQKSTTAFRLFPMFNFLFFFGIPQIIMNTKPQSFASQYLMPLISPFIAFFSCFFTKQIMGTEVTSQFFSKSYAYNISCLAIQGVFFIAATIYVQHLRFKLKDRQSINQDDEHEHDVNIGSFYRADDINPDDEIYVQHLYKKYSNGYMAIRDNSFSVKKGEIFGLLGPNGAGKSTTFNIVTAALPKTSGIVKILNENINNGIMDIFSQFGVCPQYDSIYENLTVEEHIYYAARLKGIDEQKIKELSSYYYELLSLTPYVKVKSGNLSGGNKRKLCVSMAMIANPKIMFFDEPSTGVDPISRRFLWKSLYLSARTKDAAMILTTHTMSEAQSLCSRIGILIKGRFISVATPSDLKLKYGKGFRAVVKMDFSNQNAVKQKVIGQFGADVQVQKLQQTQTIVFTIDNSKFTYSKAYHLFDNELLGKGLINKYQIKESTMEEVFLTLSQMQPEPDQNVRIREPWQFCCWECGADGCQWIA